MAQGSKDNCHINLPLMCHAPCTMQLCSQGCTLALVTGSPKVYLWTPSGASIVHMPLRGFGGHALAWSPRGSCFLLTDATGAYCCAYMAVQNE